MFHSKGPSFIELTRQALSSTIDGYDLLADKFEYTPFRTPDLFVEVLVSELLHGSCENILDIGCGTGAIPRGLLRHKKFSGNIVGIDNSTGMLEEGKRLTKEEFGNCKVDYELQDALKLSYDEKFDVVTSSGAFGHFEVFEYESLISGIYRALKPGGRFIFLTYPEPTKANPAYWLAKGFNGVMHLRNFVFPSEFIMFYLRFTVEQSAEILWRHKFDVRVIDPDVKLHRSLRLVVATKAS